MRSCSAAGRGTADRPKRSRCDPRGAVPRSSSSSSRRPRSRQRMRAGRFPCSRSGGSGAPSSSARRSTSIARVSSLPGSTQRTGSTPTSVLHACPQASARSCGRWRPRRRAGGSYARRGRSSAGLARLLALVRAGECDVAVGSRFVSGDGYEPYRYRPEGARRLGTSLLRRAMTPVLGRPFADATSGLYAVKAQALPLLAETFSTEAPEVEALIRIADAGLRLDEVPVNIAARASGEPKLRGRRAVAGVLTVVGTLRLA